MTTPITYKVAYGRVYRVRGHYAEALGMGGMTRELGRPRTEAGAVRLAEAEAAAGLFAGITVYGPGFETVRAEPLAAERPLF